MNNIPKTAKETIFSFIVGDIPLSEFETFLYESKEIEDSFKYDDYIELISLDFRKNHNRYEAIKIIEKNIDISEYEVWRLNKTFNNIIVKGKGYPLSIAFLYDLYCKGYYFLQKLGLEYGLLLDYPSEYGYKNLSELSESEQFRLADVFYPEIVYHVKLIRKSIEDGKILVTGKLDDYNNYIYIDNRNEEERIQSEF
ncbi:hypothetical protein [Leptospira selangorensis]|uniref:hypothetical protein n=1 Tax=Leptospira selangorensis TaxID=2484982 RepID=UPI001AEF9162|nr:hypothetical protein [Leptospira selangorensis]